MQPVQKKTTREIFECNKARPAPPLLQNMMIWLHNIRSMHNVGSAFRTADAFGIQQVLLSGYTPHPPRPEISKTALGADETVLWQYSPEIQKIHDFCRREGYRLIGMEQTHTSRMLTDFIPQQNAKYCILFGNEVTGMDDELLAHCDTLLEIPQFGNKHSLNISVSIGISLYHFLAKILAK